MRAPRFMLNLSLVVAASLPAAMAQTADLTSAHSAPSAAASATVVPMLVRYDGVAARGNGNFPGSGAAITFLIYKDEKGGDPLWIETQNVAIDAAGHYEIYLGSTYSSGLPTSLFGTGEARWLEVQIAGETPAQRTLLTSVPYALKAADAATLGGLPASAFALAGTLAATAQISSGGATPDLSGSTVTTTGGTSLYLPKFNAASTIIDSEIYDTGTSVGIGDVPNASARLDVNGPMIMRGNMTVSRTGNATTSTGYPSYGFDFFSNVYNSSTKATDNPYFQLQSEPTGNDTASPSATFNLLFSNNGSAPAETGLSINPNGTVHFASGQTFPGTGDITDITTTSPLTGGGTSGSVALGLNTSALETTLNGDYAQLGAANTFTRSQTMQGSLSVAYQIYAGNTLSSPSIASAPNGMVFTPVYALEAYSPNASGAEMGTVSAGTDAAIAVNNTASGGREYWIDSGSGSAGVGAGNFAVYDRTANATRMVVDPNGLVGINTGFPNGQLAVFASTTGGAINNAINAYGDYVAGSQGTDGIYAQGGTTDNSSGISAGNGGVFYGGYADEAADAGYGVYAVGGLGSTNQEQYSGHFASDIEVDGNTVSDASTSKIDHPSDPANKYLNHASVHSSEMMNMYTGNVTTDAAGHATVALPEWFEAENADFRYQLTVIGQPAQAWVAKKVGGGEFQVATSPANVEVSWLITATRQDAYAKAHPLVVEEAKPTREVGFYKHPELYGQPANKQTEWGRNPRMMRSIEDQRAAAKAHRPEVAAPALATPLRPHVGDLHSAVQTSPLKPDSK